MAELEIKTYREIIRWADYLRRNNPVEHLKYLEKRGVSVDSLKTWAEEKIKEKDGLAQSYYDAPVNFPERKYCYGFCDGLHELLGLLKESAEEKAKP